ncbi:NUDIX domain-containing protein [Bacillus sp. KH172YL63]|uniref:NUDIX domain-containing protein n=1 Tax=Bacillus sp. KH172YL63 TaxID=2709784 RepID=UPI0013E4AFF4|nr:NUDIX domain-containing protein [Bacillus sp. KH172YL63]BCB03672.1 NUDIX hydrolase [Bacillus sp. KH172YL63]
MFKTVIGLSEINGEREKKVRTAVRAVILRDDTILLMHTNRGDYKFPGGGVEAGETLAAALVREVIEETGYVHCSVGEPFGMVTQRHRDVYDPEILFEMNSHYFLCQLLDNERIPQQLEKYETELNMEAKWVPVEEAIRANEELMSEYDHNQWLIRENFVLRELQQKQKQTFSS